MPDCSKGAGALDQKVVDFFAGLNIRIIDIFGMSESSGPAAIALHPDTPLGSSGRALEGTDMVIDMPDAAGEGEILLRGRNIFREYWKNPEATKESVDSHGFLHTGDRGKIDAQGNLFITGRIKELIKTSGGENIPPVRIEQRILQELPLLSQAIVIGDGKKFLTCLVALKAEPEIAAVPRNVLDALQKIVSKPAEAEEAAAIVKEYITQGISRANKQADSDAQKVQKFAIIRNDFSVENGLMTPTLKLKRSEIEKRYAEKIAVMYRE
jgi:long-chain-fatty-acid--CoA ligase ACSBG